MFKRLIEWGKDDIRIEIFERKDKLGAGMPYSQEGANDEHITNVSSNEIPLIVTSLSDWIKGVPKDTLDKFHIDAGRFNEYKVLPRLLFGQYLTVQFSLLQKQATDMGIDYIVHYNSEVTDIIDNPEDQKVTIEVNGTTKKDFDHVIICTGHNWPKRHEGLVSGYFDSPYPPIKLATKLNHPVAIKGSSLTAVDAIRTLARYNGTFNRNENDELIYQTADGSENFRMVLHTRNGMLPAVRFHLEDSHLSNNSLLSKEEIAKHISSNDGFLSLDYIFENDFKLPIKEKEPTFYERIKEMSLEEFVSEMMSVREEVNPFDLLKAEYAQAEKSIRRKKSVYWKEMLGVLSFALNYPAKYLSAEDMGRLHQSLSPLISIVIAYIPQSSSEEILALNCAGVLDLIPVGDESKVEPSEEQGAIYHYSDAKGKKHSVHFDTYVDCVGQPHLAFEDLPFKGLLEKRTVSPARLKYKSITEGESAFNNGNAVIKDNSGNYYLKVLGIAINDHFQVLDAYGAHNDRIYMMAVPYIGGFNPDYSGLDFSEAASDAIIKRLFL